MAKNQTFDSICPLLSIANRNGNGSEPYERNMLEGRLRSALTGTLPVRDLIKS